METKMYSENMAIDEFQSRAPLEEVIDPGLPIIDAHHHLWDIRPLKQGPTSLFQQKVYLCEEIMRDINDCGHNIVQTVFAQCGAFYRADGPEEMQVVGETEFVHGIAAMSRSGIYGNTRLCAGIFSAADMRRGPAVEPVLKAHISASEYFRGIRTAFPSDLNKEFLEGFALLGKYKLSYDNWSPDFDRLPLLADLAKSNTDVTVIVNHLGGKINIEADSGEFARWQSCIEAVAECPNTFIKLGGAQMRIGDWEPAYHMNQCENPLSSDEYIELLYPYYCHCIDAFGIERCMFESNFPVDRECISYRSLWNLFKRIAEKFGASDGDKQDLFSGTASRAYRLNAP